jgi:hypothetical protein
MPSTRRELVLSLGEAAGRSALAEHLAIKTTLSIEQIRAALACSPADPDELVDRIVADYRHRMARRSGALVPVDLKTRHERIGEVVAKHMGGSR